MIFHQYPVYTMLDLIVIQINSRHFDDLMTLIFNVLQRATQYGEFSFWIIFYLSNLRQVRIQLYMYMYLSDFSLISYNMQYNLFWKTKAILAIWGSSFLIVVVIVVVYWCIGIHYIPGSFPFNVKCTLCGFTSLPCRHPETAPSALKQTPYPWFQTCSWPSEPKW